MAQDRSSATRLQTTLKETVLLISKSSMPYKETLSIKATILVTADEKETVTIHFGEDVGEKKQPQPVVTTPVKIKQEKMDDGYSKYQSPHGLKGPGPRIPQNSVSFGGSPRPYTMQQHRAPSPFKSPTAYGPRGMGPYPPGYGPRGMGPGGPRFAPRNPLPGRAGGRRRGRGRQSGRKMLENAFAQEQLSAPAAQGSPSLEQGGGTAQVTVKREKEFDEGLSTEVNSINTENTSPQVRRKLDMSPVVALDKVIIPDEIEDLSRPPDLGSPILSLEQENVPNDESVEKSPPQLDAVITGRDVALTNQAKSPEMTASSENGEKSMEDFGGKLDELLSNGQDKTSNPEEFWDSNANSAAHNSSNLGFGVEDEEDDDVTPIKGPPTKILKREGTGGKAPSNQKQARKSESPCRNSPQSDDEFTRRRSQRESRTIKYMDIDEDDDDEDDGEEDETNDDEMNDSDFEP